MKKYPWYLKFWFSWVILTLSYSILTLGFGFLYLSSFITDETVLASVFFVGRLIGLFVPFSYYGAPLGFVPFYALGTLSLLPFLVALVFTDKLAVLFSIQSKWVKVVFNLFILLVCSCLIQLIAGGSWESLSSFARIL